MGEGAGESRDSLDWGEGKFADIVGVVEAEDSFDLVVVYVLLYLEDIGVHVLDVLDIWEYKCFLGVKSECNNIFNIFYSHLDYLL